MPAPAGADVLPLIDVVLISHNHYDHLDAGSIRALLHRNPELVCYVPKGLGDWLRRRGVKHVHELDWWQNHGHKGSGYPLRPGPALEPPQPLGYQQEPLVWLGSEAAGVQLLFLR